MGWVVVVALSAALASAVFDLSFVLVRFAVWQHYDGVWSSHCIHRSHQLPFTCSEYTAQGGEAESASAVLPCFSLTNNDLASKVPTGFIRQLLWKVFFSRGLWCEKQFDLGQWDTLASVWARP